MFQGNSMKHILLALVLLNYQNTTCVPYFDDYQFETVGLHMECSLILCVLLKSLTQAANQIQDLFQKFNQGPIL